MPEFPMLSDQARMTRLALPSGKVRAVLDTDTYNEIDDQFAVAYAMLSPEHLEMEAIYAAPFSNYRSSGPADGMQKSYEEILRILDRLGRPHENFVFKGSTSYLPSADEPVDSPAARHLVSLAMARGDRPLYVLAIGAITNVASAILIEPEIIERIVVVWLGGNPLYWPHANEFNLAQDVHAARLIFDCGVPLVHIPCMNVAEHLRTTIPEVEHYLKGKGPLADYLAEIFIDYVKHGGDTFARSKVIWDISTVAFIVDPQWMPSELAHSPILTDQPAYSVDGRRHLIRIATHAERDAVFGDLFKKITNLQNKD